MLYATIDVGTRLIPRVTVVVLLKIGIGIGKENLTGIPDVGKRVKNVSKLISRKLSWLVVASIDSLEIISTGTGTVIVGMYQLTQLTK